MGGRRGGQAATPQALLAQGEGLLEAGEAPAALRLLQAAVKAAPALRAARLALARCCLALGQAMEAEALLSALVDERPNEAEALAWLGWAKLYAGAGSDPAEAVAVLQRACRNAPDWSFAWLALGHAHSRCANSPGSAATEAFAQAIALGHPSPDAHLALARLSQARGEVEGAVALAEEALRLWPGDRGCHDLLASLREAQGEWSEAAHHLLQLVQPGPGAGAPGASWARIARLHEQARAFHKAAAAWARVIEADPDDLAPRQALTQAWIQADEAAAAVAAAQSHLALAPEAPEAHAMLAKALLHAGRAPEAVEAASAALRRAPLSARHAEGLGLAYLEAGEAQRALASFELAGRLEAPSALAALGQAWALIDLERWPEALAAAEEACARRPDLAEGHELRARILLRLGREDEALDAMGSAHHVAPDEAGPAYKLALLQAAAGHQAEARAAIAKRSPPPGRPWRELATRLRLKLGG